MPDIWKQISDRLLSNSSMPVTVKIDPERQEIVGLFQERDDVISLKRFLHIADLMYDAIKDFSGVANMIVDVSHESSTAFFFMPNDFSPIRKDFTDVFRYGIGFSSSSVELYPPSISESLYRLICTNLTYAPAYSGKRFRTRKEENILNAVGVLLEDPGRVGHYSKILEGLYNITLSYREAEEVYKIIASVEGIDPEVHIPLTKIAGCYRYTRIENVPNSPSWKSSARTPISAYEAINQLTAIGSNENTADNKTKLDLLMYAGKLMLKKKWDLNYLAPQDVNFETINNRGNR